jgi:uncharacterized protein (TIGR02646 family)
LDKTETKTALLVEQGYLCAYCMERISQESVQIEHYIARTSVNPPGRNYELQYSNMIGVCPGNEGSPPDRQTCDERRGNTQLTVNPLMQWTIDTISYTSDARIVSSDAAINQDLNDTLNLNVSFLRANRKGALDGLKRELQKRKPTKDWKTLARKYIAKLKADRIKEPYCGILIHYLEGKV